MTIKERLEARREARAKLVELLHDGHTPTQAKAELNKWGKAKYGALPWATIFQLLLPLILKLIESWGK